MVRDEMRVPQEWQSFFFAKQFHTPGRMSRIILFQPLFGS
jgi:hypothetical protein